MNKQIIDKQIMKLIPNPKTKFLKVKCKCGHEQPMFSSPSMNVLCNKCSEVIAESSSGKAKIVGKLVKEF
ncbi:MAG: 30S ribosomal protein S27e [archaeon]|nr:30S ribosomal protein S27e [archaeon]